MGRKIAATEGIADAEPLSRLDVAVFADDRRRADSPGARIRRARAMEA
jgi:hypothetical protein